LTLLGPAGGIASALAIALVLFLPVGYAVLRRLGLDARGLPGLGLALGLGYTLVPPLAWVEARLGGPYLVLPLSLACLFWLRPGRGLGSGVRALLPELLLPAACAALAFCVNRHDVAADASGLALLPGFDVSDRVFYATVGEELRRASPSAFGNPVFAGLPLQYAFLPCLAGLLLSAYSGLPPLLSFLLALPALGLFFTAAGVLALLAEIGVPRRARSIAVLLVVLGGDLSFLLPVSPGPFERFSSFFTFFSFSAESLFYNPWAFGVPLALVALVAARRYLHDGRREELLVAVLLLLGLWQTKAFAFVALVGAAFVASVAARRARLLALAFTAAAAGLPFYVWAATSGGARDGAPLFLAPLLLVRTAAANNAALAALADHAGWAAVLLVFLIGGFGLRLAGLPELALRVRGDASGFETWFAATLLGSTAAALLVGGNPTAVEGVQFLLFALSLAWLPAATTLDRLFARKPLLAAALVAVALVSPVGYLARKAAPQLVPSDGPLDADRVRLSPAALSACRFLDTAAGPEERLLVPVRGNDAASGARGLLLAALSERRVTAVSAPFHVSRAAFRERASAVDRFYATQDVAEAEAILDALAVDWVWEDAESPIAVRTERLDVAFEDATVRVHRVKRRTRT
jgi:hypothetical protein